MSVSNASLVLVDGSIYDRCPEGTEISQSDCLEALTTMAADMNYSIYNSELLNVDDWVGLPCGCFLYHHPTQDSVFLNFDTYCQNAGTSDISQLVCSTDEALDGVCSKYESTGYHAGDNVMTLQPTDAPDGVHWGWQECAQACLQYSDCEFWTLETIGDERCLLKKNKGEYTDSAHYLEGDRDSDCAVMPASAPTMTAPIAQTTTCVKCTGNSACSNIDETKVPCGSW